MSDTIRRAVIHRRSRAADPNDLESARPTLREVLAYLPAAYTAYVSEDQAQIIVEGVDNAGWTLDEYVIPRLASGLITAREVT